MLAAEMVERIRRELNDVDNEIWEEEDIKASIDRAVCDLTRVKPLEKMLDVTLDFDVEDESWVASHDTFVSLANGHIKAESETITDNTGDTTYTRDTDYTMDYLNGKIKALSTGSIVDTSTCKASYTKIQIGASISSIADELLRIEKVEYPAGNVPQQFVSFSVWGSYMTITSTHETQTTLSDGKHINIYYLAEHTAPTDMVAGSYPDFLDSAIISGAEAYALALRVLKLLDAAISDVSDADTPLAAGVSALDDVATNLADANIALDVVTTRVTAGVTFLTTGSAKIQTINAAADVAITYRQYAETEVAGALAYVQEGAQRIAMAEALIAEAAQRVAISNATMEGAIRNIELAKIIKEEAEAKYKEFWSILNDKLQLKIPTSLTSVKQVP